MKRLVCSTLLPFAVVVAASAQSTEEARFRPVQVDRRLGDRDRVELGGVTLTAQIPGTTDGGTR